MSGVHPAGGVLQASRHAEVLRYLLILLSLVFLSSLAIPQSERVIKGQNDFVSFYVGGKLAGTPALYSRAANLAASDSVLGLHMEHNIYIRPPFYAVLLKPLSLLPYRVAWALFCLISLLSILWFVFRFARECAPLPYFTAMSIPAISALCAGQDSPLLLLAVCGSILLNRRSRPFAAGLVFALCAIKFHLFLFVPLVWILKLRWKILGGAVCGTAMLTGLGMIVNGVDSARQFIDVLRDPWINARPAIMPNIHGLASILRGGQVLEITLALSVFVAFLYIIRNTCNDEYLLAISIICGLLVSYHSWLADDILLLPAYVIVVKNNLRHAPLFLASTLVMPVPTLMVLAGAPYSGVMPALMLVFLGAASWTSWRASALPADRDAG